MVHTEDIAERKKVEEALEKERDYLERLHNSIGEAIFTIRMPERVIEYVNISVESIFGYKLEEWLGQSTEMFYSDREGFFEFGSKLKSTLEEGKAILHTEQLLKRKNGEVFPAEITTSFIKKDGEVTQVISVIRDITERKRAEEALVTTQALLMAAIEQTHSGVIVTDAPDGNIRIANAAALEIRGKTEQSLTNIPVSLHPTCWQIFHPDRTPYAPEDLPLARAILYGEEPRDVEIIIRRETGEERWASANAAPVRNAKGEIVAGIVIFLDITERKRAEEALRESEKRYRRIFESTSDAIITFDFNGMIISMNRGAEQMLGWSREELVGQHYRKISTPRTIALARERNRRALAGEKLPPIFETELVCRDGRIIPVEANSHFTYNKEGAPVAFQGIYRDITERKQREMEQAALLQLSQAFLTTLDPQVVMEQAAGTISQILGEERVTLRLPDEKWEKAVVRYVRGWTRNILGQEVSLERWQESGGAYALKQQTPVVVEDTTTESRFCLLPETMAEGVRSVVAVPMLAQGKPLGVLAVYSLKPSRFSAVDVHLLSLIANQTAVALERAQLHHKTQTFSAELEQRVEERTRELREAQENLVRKEKLATLGQLASNMAHELRQPLSVMTNALYYLRMRMEPQEIDSDIREYLGILQTEVNVAEKIVRDLLDFARIRPPQRQAVAVGEVVMEQMVRLCVPSTVRVQQEFPPELPPVYVDRVQIGQVISNLLRNALEAMERQGGTLTLAGAQAGNGQVVLSVTDAGEGIPAENLEKIFEPLFTTKARGIGLGLSVSQGLAQANGGDLQVQSQVGEGSTFTLVLPVPPP